MTRQGKQTDKIRTNLNQNVTQKNVGIQTLPVLGMTNPNVNSSKCATQYHDFPNPDGRKNRPITPRDSSIQT